jgi:DNA modification methylase
MKKVFKNNGATSILLQGDCLEVMQELFNKNIQVDSVVCDPPYHLQSIVKRFGKKNSAPAKFGTDGAFARASKGFMGKEWDGGDIAFNPATWELVMKILKPGGHLLAFSGSRTYHRMAVAIEDAGFEIRDQIMWLYGSGFPKSHDVSKGIDKAAGVQFESNPASGVGFMGPDGPGGYNVTKNKLSRVGESSPEAQQWEGWGTALKPAHEPLVLARKPLSEKTVAKNVLKHGTGAINIDASRIGNGNVKPDYIPNDKNDVYGKNMGGGAWENTNGRFPANIIHDGSEEVEEEFAKYGNRTSEGSASRFFYCAKTSKKERGKGNDHPTVKPQALMTYLCNLITPPNGIVFDPFMGSGSTGLAASNEGFRFIGIEKDEEYFQIACNRYEEKEQNDSNEAV